MPVLPAGLSPGALVAGRYRVEKLLGAGAMGVVLAANHVLLKHRVALKVMLPGGPMDDEATRRFEREARIAASLRGEHIARVVDAGRTDAGDPFIAMEYLAGTDLEAVVTRRGPLPVSEAASHLLAVCEALAEAHAGGIVHRDIKPSNLFLTRRPDGAPLVKVLDFGISKLVSSSAFVEMTITGTATTMGSPAFMSPEQARSARDVDVRSDIWSLGVVLYRLCTADFPFKGTTLTEVLSRILTDEPEPISPSLGVPEPVRAIIARCLRKDRTERWANVAELAESLLEVAPPDAAVHARRARAMLEQAARQDATTSPSPMNAIADVPPTNPPTLPPTSPPQRSTPTRRMALVVGAALVSAAVAVLVAGPSSETSTATRRADSQPRSSATISAPDPQPAARDAGVPPSVVRDAAAPSPGRTRVRSAPRPRRERRGDADLFELRQ